MNRAWGNSPCNTRCAPAGSWKRSYQYDTLVSGPRMLRPSSGPPGTPQKQVDVTDAGWPATLTWAWSALTGRRSSSPSARAGPAVAAITPVARATAVRRLVTRWANPGRVELIVGRLIGLQSEG